MHKTYNSIETHKGKATYHHNVRRKTLPICWHLFYSLYSVKTETHYLYKHIQYEKKGTFYRSFFTQ